jgi:hypothetical protein
MRSSLVIRYLSCEIKLGFLRKLLTLSVFYLALVVFIRLPRKSRERRKVKEVRLWSNRISSRRSKSCRVEDFKYFRH